MGGVWPQVWGCTPRHHLDTATAVKGELIGDGVGMYVVFFIQNNKKLREIQGKCMELTFSECGNPLINVILST